MKRVLRGNANDAKLIKFHPDPEYFMQSVPHINEFHSAGLDPNCDFGVPIYMTGVRVSTRGLSAAVPGNSSKLRCRSGHDGCCA